MRVRGASDPGLSYRCLATFQPCNWLGDQAGFPIRGETADRGPSAAGRCSVLPWETLRARDDRRARRRTDLAGLEQLEGRQLLSYSSLGYSLPDLQISGLAGPVASWGSTYQVTVVLQNTGASTIIEPLSLVPASEVAVGPDGSLVPPYYVPSSADAAASQIGIYLAPRPHSLAGAIEIGTATAPALSQNDIERFNVSLTLPAQPAGFRSTGVYYIRLVENSRPIGAGVELLQQRERPSRSGSSLRRCRSSRPPRWTCPTRCSLATPSCRPSRSPTWARRTRIPRPLSRWPSWHP